MNDEMKRTYVECVTELLFCVLSEDGGVSTAGWDVDHELMNLPLPARRRVG